MKPQRWKSEVRSPKIRRAPGESRASSDEGSFSGVIQRQQLLFVAVERAQAFPQGGEARRRVTARLDGGQLPDQSAVSLKGKGYFRVSQRGQRQVVLDMGGLGLLGAQEFPARRQIEEELAHLHRGARGAACRLDLQDLPAIDDDLRAFGRLAVALARGEGEAADAGDAGQGLAAKAHGRYGREVFGAPDLAGGMPLQAEQRVIAAHAEAVIHHAHEAASARLNLHRYARSLGIQRVLDQLLHDAGRPLDHFAGGDLVGHLLGQQADAVHRFVTRLHELHSYMSEKRVWHRL